MVFFLTFRKFPEDYNKFPEISQLTTLVCPVLCFIFDTYLRRLRCGPWDRGVDLPCVI